MLKNTFHHIPGVAAKSEISLWNAGIREWEHLYLPHSPEISPRRLSTLKYHIWNSLKSLEEKNYQYFAEALPVNLHWRFFPELRREIAYIDIETTGLGNHDEITTIALYDGQQIKYFVNGKNLEKFPEEILAYKVVVTYNGKCFDVPFIENFFNISMNHVHIDLRYVLKSLGYGGGLKECEKKMGIDRGDLKGVDGYFAVLLWQGYCRSGNEKFLETLLAYNIEDVVNLEILMVMAYNEKIRKTPFFESHRIPLPEFPEIDIKPDMDIVNKIKEKFYNS